MLIDQFSPPEKDLQLPDLSFLKRVRRGQRCQLFAAQEQFSSRKHWQAPEREGCNFERERYSHSTLHVEHWLHMEMILLKPDTTHYVGK